MELHGASNLLGSRPAGSTEAATSPSHVTIAAHPGRLLWHNEAHVKWGHSSLKFWFLTFRHGYDPDEVLHALHDVALEHGLHAYASYEMLGPTDILLRMYIPRGTEDALRASVVERLQRHHLDVIDRFKAVDVVRHWAWASDSETDGGVPRKPKSNTLRRRRPPAEIAVINEIGHLAEQPETIALTTTNHDLLSTYLADDLVTFAARSQGIRMITTVSHPTGLNHRGLDSLTKLLSSVLDESHSGVRECSLYRGDDGQHMLFLLMYRVSFEYFHSFRRGFLQRVHEIAGGASASAMTSVIVSDDVKCFVDALPEELDDSSTRNYRELLAADESHDFEVKGSAFAMLTPWLQKRKDLEENDSFFRDTILKTICGFLNTRGGVLVVGALEFDKPEGKKAMELADYPRVGPHVCIGLVDPSFVAKGWDAYLRHCSVSISNGIEPLVDAHIQIKKGEHGGRDLMVVTVDEPDDAQPYFVPEGSKSAVFYYRRDNSTLSLRGYEVTRYMEQVAQRRKRRQARLA
jgi:Putative DNA-binding domain